MNHHFHQTIKKCFFMARQLPGIMHYFAKNIITKQLLIHPTMILKHLVSLKDNGDNGL
ncbi:hypothetical protein [Winogradskyella pacifica]|nr:hypothetical protein [Winogradskyella pacifica]